MVAAQVSPPARRPLFSCSPGAPESRSQRRDHQFGRIIGGGFRCRGHRRPDEFPGPRRIGCPDLGIGATPAGKQPAVPADSAPVPVRIRAAGTEPHLLPWNCTGASSWTSSAGPARRRAGTSTHPPLGTSSRGAAGSRQRHRQGPDVFAHLGPAAGVGSKGSVRARPRPSLLPTAVSEDGRRFSGARWSAGPCCGSSFPARVA